MKQKTNVRRLTELALLMSIVLVMAFTPLGYLKTPWGVDVTFIVVPVAVGAVVMGPGAGAFLGLVFGLTSFANAFKSAMGAVLLQESILGTMAVCIGARVLVGLIPGLIYKAFKPFPKARTAGQAVCCFLTPVVNTALYMAGNYLIFSDTWLGVAQAAGYEGQGGISLLTFMLGMVAINGICEAIACLILGTAVCKGLIRTLHRNEG